MSRLTVIKPYNDEKLVFNKTTNRYELSFECAKALFDNNFADDDTLKKRLTKNSRKIYNYIKYHSYSGNRQVIEGLLNKTAEGRKFLFDVLLEQFEADVDSGFNDLSSAPAVNVANGQIIPREELQKNQISVDAEQIIDGNAGYFGFNICISYKFPVAIFVFFYNNLLNA